jgi:hypothetical protein
MSLSLEHIKKQLARVSGQPYEAPPEIHYYNFVRCGLLWRKIKVIQLSFWTTTKIEIGIFNSMKEAKLAVKLLS